MVARTSVANTRAVELDEALARGEILVLGHRVVLRDLDGLALRRHDRGRLDLRDVRHSGDLGWCAVQDQLDEVVEETVGCAG